MQRRSVTIHYRKLTNSKAVLQANDLQKAILNAFDHRVSGGLVRDHWKARVHRLPPNQKINRMVNTHDVQKAFAFGDLTQFEQGALQALIETGKTGPSIDVAQNKAPTNYEFVQSLMYWFIQGNHVLMIQSQALQGRHLEEYLEWLLSTMGAELKANQHIVLEKELSPEHPALALQDIREIEIGGTPVHARNVSTSSAKWGDADAKSAKGQKDTGSAATQTGRLRSVGETRTGSDRGLDVLRAAMTDPADADRLVNSLPEGAELDVRVKVGFRTHRRGLDRSPMTKALRNLPESDVVAHGRNGKLSGGDLFLSYAASVKLIDSLLDPDDILRSFKEAFKSFVDNGRIEP